MKYACNGSFGNKAFKGGKGITHYLGDKNRFDVSNKGPSWGISVGGGGGGRGKHACFYISEYIKTTRDKIKTNQMDLIKTRNKYGFKIRVIRLRNS